MDHPRIPPCGRGERLLDKLKKLFRVTDNALVVYEGLAIIAVKHADGSPWLIWNTEHQRWDKALPERAKGFQHLPLAGHVEN